MLPELEALRGVEQNPYHHLDVHGHTIEVLLRAIEVESDLTGIRRLRRCRGSRGCSMSRSLMSSRAARRFASRRCSTTSESRRHAAWASAVGSLFVGHDRAGARMVRGLCSRMRTSRRLADYLANLTLNHLRLGFLVHAQPLSRRHVYDYLLATGPDSVDVTLLTVADRLATQGDRTSSDAVDRAISSWPGR